MLLIVYLFDIRSEKKLVEEISLNLVCCYYIGYDLNEEIPDHSIFSKAMVRFGKKLFLEIFEKILSKCMGLRLVSKEGSKSKTVHNKWLRRRREKIIDVVIYRRKHSKELNGGSKSCTIREKSMILLRT